MPEGPLPKLILSKKRLRETWKGSRDASSRPAKPGIDFQTAISFGQKIESNIDRLHHELMDRKFRFCGLKPVLIPKDSGKIRVICVPTVRDRLVQRAIMTWLVERKRVPHQDFVYGIKGQGSRAAIDRAIKLRETFHWCVKTDIQSFFDRISRPKLKTQLAKELKGSSLIPLLFAAIDVEIKPRTSAQAADVTAAGINPGVGIRQGMPLSPLLANFSLEKFDKSCKANNIKILRYADDVVAFFHTKDDAIAGFNIIKNALKELELYVPDIGEAKTELIGRDNPVSFLGREIVRVGPEGTYVSRVGDKKMEKIKDTLSKDYSLKRVMDENITFDDAITSLSASIRSYFGSYKDAHDYLRFESEIRGHYKKIIKDWLREIFGADAMDKLSEQQRKFLGIHISENLEPTEDIELT
jgi:RNA-directed DNA polymerase